MNCLLYARVSTDKQAHKDLSIPAQIAAMKEYAKRNGWHVVGHFVDEGESAKTADRPELKRLIQHCKENKNVDIVLVHKIDRVARNLVDYATIKAILKQKGIRLVSVSERFDDNPIGHLLGAFIAIGIIALLYNFAQKPAHFLFLQAMAGLAVGCLWPPINGAIS